MKLSDATELDVSEARYLCETTILEDGEGPRWKFNYDNWHNDPKPDILLLGAYRNPNTGNNLVGGINLHYINQEQRDRLARYLPQIMKYNNLRRRYWAGRQLVPDIFNNFYRTYNSRLIRGVSKDVLYPKYGYLRTAQNWLKKKLSSLFKSKKDREQEAQPKYPEDLRNMQDRLDQAVVDLVDQPSTEPQDTPEMQAATKAFQDYQRQKSLRDIEQQENEPMDQAQQDLEAALQQPGVQNAERYATQEPSTPKADPEQTIRSAEKSQQDRLRQDIENVRRQNRERNSKLKDVDPNIDITPTTPIQPRPQQPQQPSKSESSGKEPDDQLQDAESSDVDLANADLQTKNNQSAEPDEKSSGDEQMKESIYYFSPKLKTYILEQIELL